MISRTSKTYLISMAHWVISLESSPQKFIDSFPDSWEPSKPVISPYVSPVLRLYWLASHQSSHLSHLPAGYHPFYSELDTSITQSILDHLWKCLVELLSVMTMGKISLFIYIFIFMYAKGSLACTALSFVLFYLINSKKLCRLTSHLQNPNCLCPHTGWGKSTFTIVSTWNTGFILVLFINYCIIFHINNYKPTFAPPCTLLLLKHSWYHSSHRYCISNLSIESSEVKGGFNCINMSYTVYEGVKLIFTGGHISLMVGFKGLNIILGLRRCNYSLTRGKELGPATR